MNQTQSNDYTKFNNKRVDVKTKWCVIELAEDISFEEHSDAIEKYIPEVFGDVEYFIPLYKEKVNGKIATLVLFEGYFFVRSFEDLCKSPDKYHNDYIKGPMKEKRVVVELTGADINKLKRELSKKLKERIPKKNQIVVPKIGVFSNLEGEVVSVDKKNLVAVVRFKYNTRIVDAPINFINLDLK